MDEVEAFARAQAAARKRRLMLGALSLVVASGLAIGIVQLLAPTDCERLVDEMSLLGATPPPPLRERIESADPGVCASTLRALAVTRDTSTRQALLTRALGELVPELAAFQEALSRLPVAQKAAFLKKLERAPPEERPELINAFIETGSF